MMATDVTVNRSTISEMISHEDRSVRNTLITSSPA